MLEVSGSVTLASGALQIGLLLLLLLLLLLVEPSGQHGRLTNESGQNVLNAEKS